MIRTYIRTDHARTHLYLAIRALRGGVSVTLSPDSAWFLEELEYLLDGEFTSTLSYGEKWRLHKALAYPDDRSDKQSGGLNSLPDFVHASLCAIRDKEFSLEYWRQPYPEKEATTEIADHQQKADGISASSCYQLWLGDRSPNIPLEYIKQLSKDDYNALRAALQADFITFLDERDRLRVLTSNKSLVRSYLPLFLTELGLQRYDNWFLDSLMDYIVPATPSDSRGTDPLPTVKDLATRYYGNPEMGLIQWANLSWSVKLNHCSLIMADPELDVMLTPDTITRSNRRRISRRIRRLSRDFNVILSDEEAISLIATLRSMKQM